MPRRKILLAVTTYPLPSRSYDELVCTAGILENGEWIRIYPVPLSFLTGQRKSGKMMSFKYTWLELNIKKRTDDFRPESYSPIHYDFKDLVVLDRIDTANNWQKRKDLCLNDVYKYYTADRRIKSRYLPPPMAYEAFKKSLCNCRSILSQAG